ncbi:D-beta-hydroxybutyrate dehydrogenase, mitochondrial [Halotydeus destructor]|nr:D-beta-hydroxybutyrate dehydrogenase, mitochondrial [Halotydeus destructor]
MGSIIWSMFTLTMILTIKLSPVLLPFIAEFGTWLLLSTIAWKFSHFVTKHLILRNFGRVESEGKAILITGCDTGFGHQLALQLNKLGYHVFAGCLFEDGEGAKALKAEAANPRSMQVLSMDVTSYRDVAQCKGLIANVLINQQLTLHGLVNNAGIASPTAIEFNGDSLATDFHRVMDVNFYALVRTCRTFLPLLRQSRGRVVNLTSVSGRLSTMSMAKYSASKHAAVSFSETLALEVETFGIKVCSIEPWLHQTPMTDFRFGRNFMIASFQSSPEEVQDAYGAQYLEMLINGTEYSLRYSEKSTQPVIEALVDALTSAEPDPVYHVMPLYIRVLYFILVDFLPREISYFLVSASNKRLAKLEINSVKQQLDAK